MKTYQDLEYFSQWSDTDKDQFAISIVKGLVMDATREANSGHPGGPMSCADFAFILYKHYLVFDPNDPTWFNRDRFILSGGHMSMVQYALLLFSGWLELNDIKGFRQLHSNTPGHPEVEIPGVECTTGPLGQGFAMGAGMAQAEAYLRNILTNSNSKASSLVDHYTYVLASDGDLQEPVTLGTASLAGHLGLSKLIVYYDANKAQISGKTNRSDSTNYKKIFDGFNWHVQEIDGHNHNQIKQSIENAQKDNRPSIIIGNTIMAKGTASMEGDHNTHGAPLPQKEIVLSKLKLGLPNDKFYFPEKIKMYYQSRFSKLSAVVKLWNDQKEQLSSSNNNTKKPATNK